MKPTWFRCVFLSDSTQTKPIQSKHNTYMEETLTHDNNASKLPIKRKTPPLKFHRIWTEPDEIRFLQGLLDSDTLSFPRDLQIFYNRFSNTMSQPYTKSQLSEKLRRLRKKFRVISSRLSNGMDYSNLSSHDRALFDLARRLWHPDYAATSPFNNNNNNSNNRNVGEGLVGITVDFAPTISIPIINGDDEHEIVSEGKDEEVVKLNDVNVEIEGGDEVGEVAVKAVMEIFEESVEELKGKIEQGHSHIGNESFHGRWKKQRIEELDVLAKRMRLLLENYLTTK